MCVFIAHNLNIKVSLVIILCIEFSVHDPHHKSHKCRMSMMSSLTMSDVMSSQNKNYNWTLEQEACCDASNARLSS